MPNLMINKVIANKQAEQGYQNTPVNGILGNVQNSETNRKIYTSFIKTRNFEEQQQIPLKKHIVKTVFSAAGGLLLLLCGVDFLLGGRNIIKLRGKLNQSIITMQSLKDHKHIKTLDKAKLGVTKFFSDALGVLFSFDKIKDVGLLKIFESLGKPGKFIINASKSSLYVPEKSLTGLYQVFKINVNSTAKSVNKALLSPENFSNETERKLVKDLNNLLNGDDKGTKGLVHFADDLLKGIKRRTVNIKIIIRDNNIKTYREKYYPQHFERSEFKRVATNWKEALFSSGGSKDILREHWAETEKSFINKINLTGAKKGENNNFGHAKGKLFTIANEMKNLCDNQECSEEFKKLKKQVQNLNDRINKPENPANPIYVETSGERYAGRVLDLSAGGGMSEIIVPPILAGIIAYNTIHDTKAEERKEKFIKNGGPELIGGLAGWMIISNLMAVSGATGMFAGVVIAGIMKVLNKNYIKHVDEKRISK